MAIKRINQVYWLADDIIDLEQIKNPSMGTECFVIAKACEYKATSDGRWIKQVKDGSSTGIELDDYYNKSEIDKKLTEINETMITTNSFIAEMASAIRSINANYIPKDKVEACYRPIQYEITDVPEGTIIDYREKEIKVYCPDGVEFTKQSVGENGNPNMYYMTFKAYAPGGAVSFKEGDRGEIIDEMHGFDGPASGIDQYGRKYSVCWLALANFDEATGTWTYFGKNSNISKYIGWTYVVEWYNEKGVMIGTDKIRINLSNAECHNTLDEVWETL